MYFYPLSLGEIWVLVHESDASFRPLSPRTCRIAHYPICTRFIGCTEPPCGGVYAGTFQSSAKPSRKAHEYPRSQETSREEMLRSLFRHRALRYDDRYDSHEDLHPRSENPTGSLHGVKDVTTRPTQRACGLSQLHSAILQGLHFVKFGYAFGLVFYASTVHRYISCVPRPPLCLRSPNPFVAPVDPRHPILAGSVSGRGKKYTPTIGAI